MPSNLLFTIEFSCNGLRTTVISSSKLKDVGGVIDIFEKHSRENCKRIYPHRYSLTKMLTDKKYINKEFRFPEDDSLTFYIINIEQNEHETDPSGDPVQPADRGAGHEEKEDEDTESDLEDEDLEPETKRLKLTTELTAEVGVSRPETVRVNLIDVIGIRLAVEKMVSNAHQKYVLRTREPEDAYVQFANRFDDSADIPFDEFQLRSEAVVKVKETYSNDIRGIYLHMLQSNETLPGMFNKAELLHMSPRRHLAARVVHFCSAWVLTHIDSDDFTADDLFDMMNNLWTAFDQSNGCFSGQACLEAMQSFFLNDFRRELFLNVEILRKIPHELQLTGLLWDILLVEGTCLEVRLQLMKTLRRLTELPSQPFFDMLRERAVPNEYVINFGSHIGAFSILEQYFRPNDNEVSADYKTVLTLRPELFKHILQDYDAEVANGTRT